jgi:conjugative relaxase-like TrwC/TraI family protein
MGLHFKKHRKINIPSEYFGSIAIYLLWVTEYFKQVRSCWAGRLLDHPLMSLDAKAIPRAKEIAYLISRKRPADGRSFGKQMSDRVKTQFLEIVLSMRKSFSIMIVLMLNRKPELLDQCMEIVKEVAFEIDSLSAVRDRRKGKDETRLSGGMVAPILGEIANRVWDPAVHFHMPLPNVTHDPERDIMLSMDYRYIYKNVGRLAKLFDEKIEAWIGSLGFQLRDGEIACIPQEVIERFSSRKNQITDNSERLRREFEAARRKSKPTKNEKLLKFEIGVLDQHGNATWEIDENRLRTYAYTYDRPEKVECNDQQVQERLLQGLSEMGYGDLQETILKVIESGIDPISFDKQTTPESLTEGDVEAIGVKKNEMEPEPDQSQSIGQDILEYINSEEAENEFRRQYDNKEVKSEDLRNKAVDPEKHNKSGVPPDEATNSHADPESEISTQENPQETEILPSLQYMKSMGISPYDASEEEARKRKLQEEELSKLINFRMILENHLRVNYRQKVDLIESIRADERKRKKYENLLRLSYKHWREEKEGLELIQCRDEFAELMTCKSFDSFITRIRRKIHRQLDRLGGFLGLNFIRFRVKEDDKG